MWNLAVWNKSICGSTCCRQTSRATTDPRRGKRHYVTIIPCDYINYIVAGMTKSITIVRREER